VAQGHEYGDPDTAQEHHIQFDRTADVYTAPTRTRHNSRDGSYFIDTTPGLVLLATVRATAPQSGTATWYLSLEHTQSVKTVFSGGAVKDDAGHLEHSAGPTSPLKEFAGHGAHGWPVNPGRHTQADRPRAKFVEPGGQSLQYAEPFEALYFPTSHSRQHAMPPAALYLPAAHDKHAAPFGPK